MYKPVSFKSRKVSGRTYIQHSPLWVRKTASFAMKHFLLNIYIYIHTHIYIYLAASGLSCSMSDLVPRPGIEPGPPTLWAQSLSPWTSRDVPAFLLYESFLHQPSLRVGSTQWLLLWLFPLHGILFLETNLASSFTSSGSLLKCYCLQEVLPDFHVQNSK